MSQTTTSHAEELRAVEIVKQPKLSKAEEAAAKKAAKDAAKAEKDAAKAAKAKEAAAKKAAKEAAKAEKEAAKAEKDAAKAAKKAETEAKKAAQEVEKQRKAEERAAKKAATEAKKAAAADKKAEKQEKKKQKKQTNLPSSVTEQITEVNAANNGELQQEEIFESETEVATASLDQEGETTPEKQEAENEMTKWTKEHDALIEATKQHQLEEEEEEEEQEEQEEEVEEEANCKVVGPAEIQERLEAMKKVVLAARANLAAFESAYNELSELLGSESHV